MPWIDPGPFNLTIPEDGGDANSDADILSYATIHVTDHQYSPWYLNAADVIDLYCPTDGVTTSGSNYARTEFREWDVSGNTEAAWDLTDGGEMYLQAVSVQELPTVTSGPERSRTVIGQIYSVDGQIRVYFRKAPLGGYEIVIADDKYGVSEVETELTLVNEASGLTLGDQFSLRMTIKGSTCRVTVVHDGVTHTRGWTVSAYWTARTDIYFKAGNYLGVGEVGGLAGTQGTGQGHVRWHGYAPTVDHASVVEPTADPPVYEFTLVNVGSSSIANNASVTPGQPASIATGDLVVMFIGAAGSGTIGTPAGGGWTVAGTQTGTNSQVKVLYKVYNGSSLGSLTTGYTGGATGDTVISRCAAFRGGPPTLAVAFAGQANASDQNIAGVGGTIPAGALALQVGFIADNATSVAVYSSTGAAWTELLENNSGTGDDASLVVDWLWSELGATVAAGSFACTGNTAQPSVAALVTFSEEVAGITGSLTATLDAATLDATAAAGRTGSLTATLDEATLDAAASINSASTGELTATLDEVTLSAIGGADLAGMVGIYTYDDIAQLDAANDAEVGVWVSGEETYRDVMDRLAGSVGAWYGFDPATGELRMGRVGEPEGAKATLYTYDMQEDQLARRPPSDVAIPTWRVNVGYARNWTVQDSDVAGSVTDARRGFLARDLRWSTSEDADVKTKHLLAPELRVETLLIEEADAAAEAARLLALHSVPRAVYDVPVPIEVLADNDLRLMDTVELVLSRFGMSAGQAFRIIGIYYELKAGKGRTVLSLWG